MNTKVELARRFCGPPDSANGGYAAGTLAAFVGGTAEVTLRRPPPLDRPLAVERVGTVFTLLDGADLVAEAAPTTVELDLPEPVSFDDAVEASRSSPFRDMTIHPFPTCFACGPARESGDGLRLFAGRIPGTETFAAPWVPKDVDDRIVWAALDCPSCAVIYLDEDHPPPHVLGRIAARIDQLPVPGDRYVVMSWRLGVDGRKVNSASAIYDENAKMCAVARATWIRLAAAP
jgi:hypothetical protein